jgi:hypothetical protein
MRAPTIISRSSRRRFDVTLCAEARLWQWAEPYCPSGLDERAASVPVRLPRLTTRRSSANAPQRANAARWYAAMMMSPRGDLRTRSPSSPATTRRSSANAPRRAGAAQRHRRFRTRHLCNVSRPPSRLCKCPGCPALCNRSQQKQATLFGGACFVRRLRGRPRRGAHRRTGLLLACRTQEARYDSRRR